jgi:acetyl-CoA acetyltransferase
MRPPNSYRGIAVTTPVTVPYARWYDRDTHWILGSALRRLLECSKLSKREVDGLAFNSFTLGPDTTIHLTEYFECSPRWIEWIPTGGAAGVMALRRAARAVQNGDAQIVACIAGDSPNPRTFADIVRNFSTFSTNAVLPYGAAGPNGNFALITDHYMRLHGATRSDFGRIAVAQRANARANPNALLGKKSLSLEDYLNAPPVAEPLHLFDCVMPCAGAEAFLVMTDERAKSLGLPAATIRGAIERHNAYFEEPVVNTAGWAFDRDSLYDQAALGPADIDCLQTYDDYPVATVLQIEDLGFCAKGEGKEFVRSRDLTTQGDFPLNTCGGQLSCGQGGAGGGFLPVVEALRQVTRQPLGEQVPNARIAMAGAYGMITYDRCLSTGAVILEGQR